MSKHDKLCTQDIPHISDIPASAKRGYLCRLSGKKILAKSDWKRKLFILYDAKLFYYDKSGDCEPGREASRL